MCVRACVCMCVCLIKVFSLRMFVGWSFLCPADASAPLCLLWFTSRLCRVTADSGRINDRAQHGGDGRRRRQLVHHIRDRPEPAAQCEYPNLCTARTSQRNERVQQTMLHKRTCFEQLYFVPTSMNTARGLESDRGFRVLRP